MRCPETLVKLTLCPTHCCFGSRPRVKHGRREPFDRAVLAECQSSGSEGLPHLYQGTCVTWVGRDPCKMALAVWGVNGQVWHRNDQLSKPTVPSWMGNVRNMLRSTDTVAGPPARKPHAGRYASNTRLEPRPVFMLGGFMHDAVMFLDSDS